MPVLVTTVSTPPVVRPYSALYCCVWMLNSCTASMLKFCSAPPIVSSVLSPPSTRKLTLRPLPPLRAIVSWPGLVGSVLTESVVPGASEPRFANCRPLSGRFSISRWLTTVPMAGVVSISGEAGGDGDLFLDRRLLQRDVQRALGRDVDLDVPRGHASPKPDRSAVTLYVPTGSDWKR